MPALLHLNNVELAYHSISVLKDISFSIAPCQWYALCGCNGSGKSSLLRAILGLEPLCRGQIFWQGRLLTPSNYPSMRRNLGVVLQYPQEQILGQTVLDDMRFGFDLATWQQPIWQQRHRELLCSFGLWKKRFSQPSELSGGQKTLLSLASALLRKPQLLILDEPFANLDYPMLKLALKQLKEAQKQGSAILIVAHQLEPFLFHCQRLLVLKEGKLIANDTPKRTLEFLESAGVRRPSCKLESCNWLASC